MKKLPFKKIDAFATDHSEGNPAGYVHLSERSDLSGMEMLQIARELRGYVNEVGYVMQKDAAQFELRYYSAEREVDFCGHATIAIMYDLISNNPSLRQLKKINIVTNKGPLEVWNKIATDDAVYIMSPEPLIEISHPPLAEIVKFMKIETEEVDQKLPVSVINAGLSTLILPILQLESILNINPDLEELRAFCLDYGIDIILVFSAEVGHKENDYRTRVFAPTFGYLEDPATGSGNAAFGYYLLNNKLWAGRNIVIEQNRFRQKPNIVKLFRRSIHGQNRVFFGGGAISRVQGEYLLNSIPRVPSL